MKVKTNEFKKKRERIKDRTKRSEKMEEKLDERKTQKCFFERDSDLKYGRVFF